MNKHIAWRGAQVWFSIWTFISLIIHLWKCGSQSWKREKEKEGEELTICVLYTQGYHINSFQFWWDSLKYSRTLGKTLMDMQGPQLQSINSYVSFALHDRCTVWEFASCVAGNWNELSVEQPSNWHWTICYIFQEFSSQCVIVSSWRSHMMALI